MRLFWPAAAMALALSLPLAAQEAEDAGQTEAPAAENPAAQDSEAPDPAGLSDLQETIGALEDEPEQASGEADPAEPAAEQEISKEEDESPAGQAESEAEPESETQPPAEPAGPPPPLTEGEKRQLNEAVQRGRTLIAIAQAGMVGTRDMLARIADPEGAGIEGWLVEPEGNASSVTFYGDGEDGPVAIYRGTVLGGRVTSREIFPANERPALTPLQARMAAARAATGELGHEACNALPLNAFVVPPASPDAPIDVYQVTAQEARGRFPAGGHYRTTVATDGSVASSRSFANSCFDLPAPQSSGEGQPRPIGVPHLLDPLPTEIHVFLSLWSGRPLVVATGDPERAWLVTGEGIAEIRE